MAIKLIQCKELRNFARTLLMAVGLARHEAVLVEDNLVDANLKGVDSHGVVRLNPYLTGIKNGFINVRPSIRTVHETPSTALMDGDNGLGQIVGHKAALLAIEKAKEQGVGVVAVRNSNHLGTAGYYATKFASEGMLGFVLSNAPPTMAPWGGITPLLGTNPLAWAAPTGLDHPLCLDFATSVVSRGRIKMFADRGQGIPAGWAISPEGSDTTDPDEAMKGSVLPFGEYKGYGISLFIDIFCGMLSGGAFSTHLRQIPGFGGKTGKTGICHFLLGIDISKFTPLPQFLANMQEIIRMIKNSKTRDGVDEIYLPGEREFRESGRRAEHGIPFQEDEIEMLKRWSVELNVEFPWN